MLRYAARASRGGTLQHVVPRMSVRGAASPGTATTAQEALAKIEEQMATQEYEQVVATASAGLAATPGEPGLLLRRAQSQLLLRRYEDALADIDSIAAAFPADQMPVNALYVRLSAAFELGRSEQVVVDITRFLDRVDKAEYTDEQWKQLEVDLFLKRGSSHAELGAVEPGLKDMYALLQLAPQHQTALLVASKLERMRGSFDSAVKLLTRCIDGMETEHADPNMLAMLWHDRGFCNVLLGNLDAAEEDAIKALEYAPDLAYLYLLRGLIDKERNALLAAVDWFTQVIDKAGADAGVEVTGRLHRSQCYSALDEPDKAANDATHALALEPAEEFSVVLHVVRSYARLRAENYQGAVEDATVAIDKDPTQVGAYRARSIAYLKLGQPDLAKRDAARVQAMEPVKTPPSPQQGE